MTAIAPYERAGIAGRRGLERQDLRGVGANEVRVGRAVADPMMALVPRTMPRRGATWTAVNPAARSDSI